MPSPSIAGKQVFIKTSPQALAPEGHAMKMGTDKKGGATGTISFAGSTTNTGASMKSPDTMEGRYQQYRNLDKGKF